MSKYEALRRHLERTRGDRWEASFADIEQVLGFRLPASAREYHAWWAHENQPKHPHKRAWLGAGWRTSLVNLSKRTVRFERIRRAHALAAHDHAAPDVAPCADPRVGALARDLAKRTGEDLCEAVVIALRERLEREAAKRSSGLAEELLEIGRQYAALPKLSDESPDELLYDEYGAPR